MLAKLKAVVIQKYCLHSVGHRQEKISACLSLPLSESSTMHWIQASPKKAGNYTTVWRKQKPNGVPLRTGSSALAIFLTHPTGQYRGRILQGRLEFS